MSGLNALIDVPKVIDDALAAAKAAAGAEFPKVRKVVTDTTKQLGELAADIAKKRLANEITAAEADMLLHLHRNSMKVALLEIEGMAALAVEAIAKAVINVFVGALNTAVNAGLKLL